MFWRAFRHAFSGIWIGAIFGTFFLWFFLGTPLERYDQIRRYAAELGLNIDAAYINWVYPVCGALLGIAIVVPLGLMLDAWLSRPAGDVATPAGDAGAAEEASGSTDMEALRNPFTRADLEAFLKQPVPRRIPASLAHYSERFGLDIALSLGALSCGVGGVFAYISVKELSQGWNFISLDTIGGLVGLVCLAIGVPAVFLAGRARWRLRRLLRRGKLAEGKIESVAPTGTSVNDNEIHLLTVRYRLDSRGVVGTCRLIDPGAGFALKLLKEGRHARILYDPWAPERILLADALILDEASRMKRPK